MSKTIEQAAKEAIIDNNFFMADPNNPSFVDRGLEQMRACKWIINHIFSLPLASRMTAEEKERVRKIHRDYHQKWDCSCNDRESERSFYCFSLLECIFGKDFFKEGE